MSRKTHWRTAAALVASIAAIVFAGAAASAAHAQGVTWEELDARGWTCFVPPPFPDRVGCFNPGLGAPIPGNPDPPPSYSVRMFSRASGEFLHTVHLIRADLYAGQPCGDHAYRFIERIGYWECVHE
jgi:hypothetical protein